MTFEPATIYSMSDTNETITVSSTANEPIWLKADPSNGPVNIPSCSVEPEPYTLQLRRGQLGNAELFEQLACRAYEMSKRLGGNYEALYNGIWKAFGECSPVHGFWVACRKRDIVGHLIADIRQVNNEWIGYIIQEQVDDAKAIKRGLIDNIIKELEEWLRRTSTQYNLNITRAIMETHYPSEAWARRYGFTEHSTLYQRRIP